MLVTLGGQRTNGAVGPNDTKSLASRRDQPDGGRSQLLAADERLDASDFERGNGEQQLIVFPAAERIRDRIPSPAPRMDEERRRQREFPGI